MAKKNVKQPSATRIDAVRHKDKRTNIPTEELRDFVAQEEQQPYTVRYPRNPDLDPQLVWKGKDEQDSQPLEVPAVPIYIQEKVHPQAIIEDFLATLAKLGKKQGDAQLSLFSDFNGLPDDFDKRVDFYHHEGNWSNRLILGNSLLVMTSLAEKEALKGKVQMIYLDPPYGIKFGSNWQVSTRKRDISDGKSEDLTRQPEQILAFRDTWKLGIHSYLAYLRDRLLIARELLSESGSIFVQIGDENVHLVRSLLDEVFGTENWIGLISVQKTTTATNVFLPLVCDYIVWYGKNRTSTKYRSLYQTKEAGKPGAMNYSGLELPDGSRRTLTKAERVHPDKLPVGARMYSADNFTSASMGREKGEGAACWFAVEFEGKTYRPYERSRWKTNQDGMRRILAAKRVFGMDKALRYVRYFDDFPAYPLHNLWTDVGGAPDKKYVVETTTKVVERCLLMTTDPGDLVLDPTCGSGTTAYVAEQLGRRWITIDTSRVALTLARTRLMAARFPYYHLADTPEGIKKESELTGQLPPHPLPKTEGDIRRGFVYKRVPHVTLKAIANNEEIDTIHAKWQATLEPLRAKLNKLLKKKWEEWEVPREAEKDWAADAKKLLKEWWASRQGRQQEIDASIARRADTEMLYDQPYEEHKRVRVTGPFTVESLSPHRTISVEEKKHRAEVGDPKLGLKIAAYGPDQFGNMILDNLRTAGVQNTFKKERLQFDSLQPFAGQWIHGEGTYTNSDGASQRVAVCIGPEHGTVGPQLVKEAAKEAVRGVGFDLLIVCGFAFDPHVSEEAKRYGKLVVLPTRMNPDLTMGELLKKTGSGNLFMVFGEPDVEVKRQKDGRIVVNLLGLDIFDPTTGEIRSSSTDDIACWFIDTNYNGESFFVRHAYFTGADEPYEKLKRALRAEIDEAAWSALYSTTSRPFDAPETGKIAVKVINHYGDEVLKVFEV
ncbi:MAG: site-specific DNA-methyltransferase [Planctomycetota bacterium]|nr:site-specific DNA-methyltransferase [Planctomycetota bacterium]